MAPGWPLRFPPTPRGSSTPSLPWRAAAAERHVPARRALSPDAPPQLPGSSPGSLPATSASQRPLVVPHSAAPVRPAARLPSRLALKPFPLPRRQGKPPSAVNGRERRELGRDEGAGAG